MLTKSTSCWVVAADCVARLLPHDRQHRQMVELCVIESGYKVRSARTRGREAHAKLTREFRVGARHESSHFLMARPNERNLVPSSVERPKYAVNAVAGISEDPSPAMRGDVRPRNRRRFRSSSPSGTRRNFLRLQRRSDFRPRGNDNVPSRLRQAGRRRFRRDWRPHHIRLGLRHGLVSRLLHAARSPLTRRAAFRGGSASRALAPRSHETRRWRRRR